ncbi:hypothetical protein FF38_05016 [Lucilia cuprina]|uniref:Uncharacterized protein n=1 Tax=Lucilia cuprina TaxID=7375 RepID=A0A0L0CJM1_LUCCU|nr:hypothetical protein FF38_05016 [Lucilia cuprina]
MLHSLSVVKILAFLCLIYRLDEHNKLERKVQVAMFIFDEIWQKTVMRTDAILRRTKFHDFYANSFQILMLALSSIPCLLAAA